MNNRMILMMVADGAGWWRLMIVKATCGSEPCLSLLHYVLVATDVLIWLLTCPYEIPKILIPHTPTSSWSLHPRHHITKSPPTKHIPATKCNFKVTWVSHMYFSDTMKGTIDQNKISSNFFKYFFPYKAPNSSLAPTFGFLGFLLLFLLFQLCVTKSQRSDLAKQGWGPAWAGPDWTRDGGGRGECLGVTTWPTAASLQAHITLVPEEHSVPCDQQSSNYLDMDFHTRTKWFLRYKVCEQYLNILTTSTTKRKMVYFYHCSSAHLLNLSLDGSKCPKCTEILCVV